MADSADAGGDACITFKVKTSSDCTHAITMPESATVLDLKTKLSGEHLENVSVERQRLIYSGRVMKNDDSLGSYKIKPNNTIHMVKSAASNTPQTASASASSIQAVPSNMASGTANNPLAGLTGARYAGHQVHFPGMDLFGPDGGMGPPMDEERIRRMMSDPNVQQSMNEALNNPDFVNMLVESNPMLRNLPNAREIITSPFMRQMMSNPQMMSQAMQMQRSMHGTDAAFPAPGATSTTPEGAAASTSPAAAEAGSDRAAHTDQQNPFSMPFSIPGAAEGDLDLTQMLQAMSATGAPQASEPRDSQGTAQDDGSRPPPAANPFAALFPQQGASANNSLGIRPEMMEQMMQILAAGGGGGGGHHREAPADNRPPEERYAEQLRQLNDMGFFDFDRNVAALRRSGGSVQGAIEHLLSATD